MIFNEIGMNQNEPKAPFLFIKRMVGILRIKNIFMILCIWFISIGNIESEDIAIGLGNPPLMCEVNGEAEGVYPLVVREIFNRINVPLNVKALPWNRAVAYADEGKVGIVGIYKNEERLKKYDYSDEIYVEKTMVYALKKNDFVYNKVEDLKGKRIGVIRGWSYGKEFDIEKTKNYFYVDEVNDDKTNFIKLIGGRLDCVLATKEIGDYFMQNNPEYKLKIIEKEIPLLINPTYLIFSKSSNKKELLNKFNIELEKMKKNSELKILIKDYLEKNIFK